MTQGERGFLLLTSHLGDPTRPVLTTAQFRELTARMRQSDRRTDREQLEERDLVAIGCDRAMARRILSLLEQEEQLNWYLRQGRGCTPVTRLHEAYPHVLRRRLGLDAPGCLWARGELSLLDRPAVALVGSRELRGENAEFARMAGRAAAGQGYVLVSGNAVGADRTAQNACLQAGGAVISVVADRLDEKIQRPDILYLSEDGYDLPFSAQRALSRNRLIHSLGTLTLVAQSGMEKGGTWDGTVKNLNHNWSPVFVFDDGSAAAAELIQRGAVSVGLEQLSDLSRLRPNRTNFIDQ